MITLMTIALFTFAAIVVVACVNSNTIPLSVTDTALLCKYPLRWVWYFTAFFAIAGSAPAVIEVTGDNTRFLVFLMMVAAAISIATTFCEKDIASTPHAIATIAFYLAGLTLLLCNTWWLAVLPIGAFVYSVVKNDLHWRLYTTTAFVLALYIYTLCN